MACGFHFTVSSLLRMPCRSMLLGVDELHHIVVIDEASLYACTDKLIADLRVDTVMSMKPN